MAYTETNTKDGGCHFSHSGYQRKLQYVQGGVSI